MFVFEEFELVPALFLISLFVLIVVTFKVDLHEFGLIETIDFGSGDSMSFFLPLINVFMITAIAMTLSK